MMELVFHSCKWLCMILNSHQSISTLRLLLNYYKNLHHSDCYCKPCQHHYNASTITFTSHALLLPSLPIFLRYCHIFRYHKFQSSSYDLHLNWYCIYHAKNYMYFFPWFIFSRIIKHSCFAFFTSLNTLAWWYTDKVKILRKEICSAF